MKQIIIFLLLSTFSQNLSSQIFECIDIHPDGDSDVGFLINYHNKLFFRAHTENGVGLWYTDGTQEGLAQLLPENEELHRSPQPLIVYHDHLYNVSLGIINSLWKTDGTDAGTVLIYQSDEYGKTIDGELFILNEKLYFVVKNFDQNKMYLFETDGEETRLVKKISDRFFYDFEFTEFKGRVYFPGNDSIQGDELWVTDGTTEGTNMHKDLNLEGGSYPDWFTVVDDLMFFRASDDEELIPGLFVTDGSIENTRKVRGLEAEDNCGPMYLTSFDGRLFFSAKENDQRELWVSDGSQAGTHLFKDLNIHVSSYQSSNPRYLTVFNGLLYISAFISGYGEELFISNGNVNGTQLLKDLNSDESSFPSSFHAYRNKLYFKAGSYDNKYLWVSDGTHSGTYQLDPSIMTSDSPLDWTYRFKEMGGDLYFKAKFDSRGLELWKYVDATGTENDEKVKLSMIYPNPCHDFVSFDIDENIDFIEIYDLSARLMMRKQKVDRVNVSSLKEGAYIVNLITKNGIITSKLVKSK